MKKILSLCLICVLALIACHNDPVAVVHHVTNEAELRSALTRDGEIILDKDIILQSKDTTVVDSLVVAEGKNLVLNLNGHSIMTDKYYVNNINFLFDIKGTLVINDTKGGGIIGGDYSNGSTGALLVDTKGSLVLNDGVIVRTYPQTNDFYPGATYRPSSVYVKGNLLVNNAKIYSTRAAIIGTDSSNIVVKGGEFYSTASVMNKQSFVYALVLSGKAQLDNCVVRGIHGGLGITGTSITLNSGVESYLSKDIFTKIPEAYGYKKFFEDTRNEGVGMELQNDEMFYAVYCAGEKEGIEAHVDINGGKYVAIDIAAYIGNSADGGAGEKAYATIKDGTFDGGVVVDASKPNYGVGDLTIEGGKFLKSKNNTQNLQKFIRETSGLRIDETDSTYFVVTK